jgi:hypothetical protein
MNGIKRAMLGIVGMQRQPELLQLSTLPTGLCITWEKIQSLPRSKLESIKSKGLLRSAELMDSNKFESFLKRAEVTELLTRYFAALDQKNFEFATMNLIFADDASVMRPNGTQMIGPKAIGESHSKSLGRFRATQHLTSGFVVMLNDQEKAEFRGNLAAMHLWAEGFGDTTVDPNDNYFLAGGVISGKAEMTRQGWRITQLSNEIVWIKGTGFKQLLQTQKHRSSNCASQRWGIRCFSVRVPRLSLRRRSTSGNRAANEDKMEPSATAPSLCVPGYVSARTVACPPISGMGVLRLWCKRHWNQR